MFLLNIEISYRCIVVNISHISNKNYIYIGRYNWYIYEKYFSLFKFIWQHKTLTLNNEKRHNKS